MYTNLDLHIDLNLQKSKKLFVIHISKSSLDMVPKNVHYLSVIDIFSFMSFQSKFTVEYHKVGHFKHELLEFCIIGKYTRLYVPQIVTENLFIRKRPKYSGDPSTAAGI